MAKPVPSRFNPDTMARDGTLYRTELPLGRFSRLQALLADPAGVVEVSLRFSRRKDHIVAVGRLQSQFPLECQRCLEPMQHGVDERFEFVFVASEAEARRLPDGLDPVVLDDAGQIHVVDLLEDELILNLPAVPRHASTDQCGSLAGRLAPVQIADEPDGEARPNPFGVLKDLKLH